LAAQGRAAPPCCERSHPIHPAVIFSSIPLRGRRRVGRVPIGVDPAAEVGDKVGADLEVSLHVGAGIAHGEAGPAAIGGVGLRAVNGAIVVHRDFAGLQAELHGRVHIEAALLQFEGDDRTGIVFLPMLHQAALLRPGDELHAAVFLIDVVERQPDGHRVAGRKRPVIGVLVPGHGGQAVRLLDEEMAPPDVEIGSEDALDQVEDLRIHRDFIQIRAGMVPLAHLVGGLARPEQGQQIGQLGVDARHLLPGVNGREAQKIAPIEIGFELLRRETVGLAHSFRWFVAKISMNSTLHVIYTELGNS